MNIVEQFARVVITIGVALGGPRVLITIVSPAELRGLARGEEDKQYFDSFWAHCWTDSLVSLNIDCARSIIELFSGVNTTVIAGYYFLWKSIAIWIELCWMAESESNYVLTSKSACELWHYNLE